MTTDTDANRSVVEALYRAWARGDHAAAIAMFDDDVQWYPAEGHPYSPEGKPWIGLRELTEKFFNRVGAEWTAFATRPDQFHVAGYTVIVEGRYTGTFLPRRSRYNAEFCHIWTLSPERKILRLKQYADTAQMQRVMAGGSIELSEGNG